MQPVPFLIISVGICRTYGINVCISLVASLHVHVHYAIVNVIVDLFHFLFYTITHANIGTSTCFDLENMFIFLYSENNKVSHYIISRRQNCYLIGDQSFQDLHSVIDFYKNHFLDTTTLTECVSHHTYMYMCLSNIQLHTGCKLYCTTVYMYNA